MVVLTCFASSWPWAEVRRWECTKKKNEKNWQNKKKRKQWKNGDHTFTSKERRLRTKCAVRQEVVSLFPLRENGCNVERAVATCSNQRKRKEKKKKKVVKLCTSLLCTPKPSRKRKKKKTCSTWETNKQKKNCVLYQPDTIVRPSRTVECNSRLFTRALRYLNLQLLGG